MKLDRVPKVETPVFFDTIITQVQDALAVGLPWLDHIFGQSQTLIRLRDKKEFKYPGVHIKKGRYQSVHPDQGLGNFSFFILHDPQEIKEDQSTHGLDLVECNFSLVLWFNMDKVFGKINDRNMEVIKAQVLKVLKRDLFLKSGRLKVTSLSQEASTVYKGYDLKEVDTQYLMQPFGGLRLEGTLQITETC